MRFAILISFAVCGVAISMARADGPLIRVFLGSQSGYIVPESYAREHRADLVASIAGPVKIEGFWTPPEQDVAVADRAFRDLIHAGVKDPALLFPDLAPRTNPNARVSADEAEALEQERKELALVSENYNNYSRQYVGIIIEGQKIVFCNYSEGTKVDPAVDYIFIHKVFAPGAVHFLQCRFEPLSKICSKMSFIGSWKTPEK